MTFIKLEKSDWYRRINIFWSRETISEIGFSCIILMISLRFSKTLHSFYVCVFPHFHFRTEKRNTKLKWIKAKKSTYNISPSPSFHFWSLWIIAISSSWDSFLTSFSFGLHMESLTIANVASSHTELNNIIWSWYWHKRSAEFLKHTFLTYWSIDQS